jgi:hypothetical protein
MPTTERSSRPIPASRSHGARSSAVCGSAAVCAASSIGASQCPRTAGRTRTTHAPSGTQGSATQQIPGSSSSSSTSSPVRAGLTGGSRASPAPSVDRRRTRPRRLCRCRRDLARNGPHPARGSTRDGLPGSGRWSDTSGPSPPSEWSGGSGRWSDTSGPSPPSEWSGGSGRAASRRPDPPASVLGGKNLCREVGSLAQDEAVAVTSGTEASPIAAI